MTSPIDKFIIRVLNECRVRPRVYFLETGVHDNPSVSRLRLAQQNASYRKRISRPRRVQSILAHGQSCKAELQKAQNIGKFLPSICVKGLNYGVTPLEIHNNVYL